MNLKHHCRLRTFAVLLFACAAAAGPAAADAPENDVMHAFVSYADLDLGQPAGLATLRGRIHAAAQQVCGESPDARELERYRLWRTCVADAQERALNEVTAGIRNELAKR
jgi:UrcA family protein